MNSHAINARARAIYDELSEKSVSPQRVQQLSAELDQLDTASRTHKAALGWAGSADLNPNGNPPGQPTQLPTWQLPEGPGLEHRATQAPRPEPLRHGPRTTGVAVPCRENRAVVLLPNAFSMRVEPTRIAEYFPVVESEGQTVSWIQHTANAVAASALAVAENAQKSDISPTLAAFDSTYSVVAGLAKVSKQLFTDFDDVASFMPRELSNWIIIGENYQLLQGNGTAPNQLGLFNATGTLARQYNDVGGDTIIDTVLEAVTDIRVGGAYAQADLILAHPNDWLAMRKLKTTFNSYVLDPNDPNTLGGIDNLFGIRVVTSTQVPQGSVAVLDSKIAVNIFRRWGLEIMANPYADSAFEYNQIHYRAETRFALGVIYPEAICLVNLTDAG